MRKNQKYFDHPAISRGKLLNFVRSAKTGAALINTEYDSSAMNYGRGLHSYLAGDFDQEFFYFDDSTICEEIGGAKPRSTKKYKEWKAKLFSENAGKEPFTIENYYNMLISVDNLKDSDFYAKIHKGKIINERPFYATIDGKEYKALVDRTIEYNDLIVCLDWKTTRIDLDPNNTYSLISEIRKYKLNFQQKHYKRVIKAATGKEVEFVFVFMENHSGFEFLPVTLKEDGVLMEEANLDYAKALENYEKYLNDEFESINDKIIML